MNFASILLIGIGLSMDAFAIAITCGIIIKGLKVSHILKVGIFFGIAQAVMPLIGWIAGSSFSDYIIKVDHWIAFGLLTIIGGKMLLEASKDECETGGFDPLDNKSLLVLAIATSIDALAVGISFAFLQVNIYSAIAIIGIVTFIICTLGVILGKQCGCLFKSKAQFLGGAVLIFMGFKILNEHTGLTSYIGAIFK